MKHISKFINEQLNLSTVHNVKAAYKVEPSTIYIEVPVNYSESDIQIYIGDMMIENMPSSETNCSRLFGKNAQYIDDAYFDYERIEPISTGSNIEPNIKWDNKYDDSKMKVDLHIMKIESLKYFILFSDFEIYCENDDQIPETMEKIFKASDSDSINDYKLSIRYSKELTEYDEPNK